MTRKAFTMAAIGWALFALTAAPAAAKPNFSGNWKLVADKSDFGPMPAPDKLEYKNNHSDPELKMSVMQVSAQGEFNSDLTYSTDGKETTNKLREMPVKSVAKWEGDALLIDSKLDLQGNEVTLSDKWTLSEDGKTITINRKVALPQGEFESKIVLEKQ